MFFRTFLLLAITSQLIAYNYPSETILKQWYTNKKVLVTGGYGFIGSHIVEKLIQLGAHVVVLDNFCTGKHENIMKSEHISVINGSITNPQTCIEAALGVDIIFHLAAFVSVPLSIEQPRACYESNIKGTSNVLEAARINNVKQFILSSSSAVYSLKDCACTEDMHCTPASPYRFSKLIDELLCQQYSTCFGLQTICLRYFNV